jgi:hypothetical protein
MALAVGWPTGPGATGAEACGQLAGAEARGHGPSCSDSAAPRRTRLQGPAPGARCCGSWHQRGALTARRERCNSQEATQLTTRPRRLSLYEGAMYAVQSGMASRRALQRTNRRCILLPWGGGAELLAGSRQGARKGCGIPSVPLPGPLGSRRGQQRGPGAFAVAGSSGAGASGVTHDCVHVGSRWFGWEAASQVQGLYACVAVEKGQGGVCGGAQRNSAYSSIAPKDAVSCSQRARQK